MIKYNEIMSHITVDPEMKSRVMSAVSSAIKENPDGAAVVTDIKNAPGAKAPERKKARRTPIALISSIAAGVLVLLGALFVFMIMNGKTKKAASTDTNGGRDDSNFHINSYFDGAAAEDTVAVHNDEVDLDDEIDKVVEDTTAVNAAESESPTSVSETRGTNDDIDLNNNNYHTILPTRDKDDYSVGMGDEYLDTISRTLPFELVGSGKGSFSSDITMEVFFGAQSQKVLLLAAPEGTDIIKQFDPSNKTTGTDGTTPAGTAVKYYRIVFGNVTELGKNETSSDINAALYTRDGMTYLLVFSDPQTPETIAALVDVI